ncbi:MAG TPA: hypothetical protein PLX35_11850 [Cyclobacteriaceae bacterium]|nr:hypothetical protein [Cyclobacteriaceae bacterium]
MKKIYILVLALVCSRPGIAQRETFDLWSFVPPSGWERTTNKDAISFLKYNSDKSGYCLIAIYDHREATNDVRKEFDIEWKSLIEDSKQIPTPASPSVEEGSGWTVITGSNMSSTTPPYLANLISMVGEGKIVSALVFISDESFMPVVKQFIADLRLERQTPVTTNAPSAATQGQSTQPNSQPGITGIWRSLCNDKTSISTVYNSNYETVSQLTTTGGLRAKHLILFSDGIMCSYPSGRGFRDHTEQRKEDPNTWGTYQFSSGSGQFKFDGLSTAYPFTIQNDRMQYEKCVYDHMPWVENLKLSGTWSVETNPEEYKAKGMNAEPVIRFGTDGRFADVGAVYYLNHIKGSSEDFSDNKYGDGRYEIKKYTLTLIFDDGRTYDYTYLNFDGNISNPKEISVGFNFLSLK